MNAPALRAAVRRIPLAVAVLLLGVVAWVALAGGLRQIPRTHTFGQRFETAVQLACGILSVLTGLTRFCWRGWGPRVRAAWAVSLATAAGVSSLVWGPPSVPVGVAFAAGTLLVALGIVRLLGPGAAA